MISNIHGNSNNFLLKVDIIRLVKYFNICNEICLKKPLRIYQYKKLNVGNH